MPLSDVKGLGTLVGFITNGPEALCMLVGLAAGDILYAASTPLGSNFVNPLFLFVAAWLSKSFLVAARTRSAYTWVCIALTATLAGLFFATPESLRFAWWGAAALASLGLFLSRGSFFGGTSVNGTVGLRSNARRFSDESEDCRPAEAREVDAENVDAENVDEEYRAAS